MAGEQVYLGFDFGQRRIGVAVGQALTGAARPLTTLACATPGAPDWERIGQLLQEWQPAALVVGVPRHADGADSALTAAAERFGRRLHGRFALPVHLIDEQLSSHAAERELSERGRGGRRLAKHKHEIDSLAAAIILETWLAERHE